MQDRVSWEDLRVFEVVAREASFTRAARLCHTTQPALSRRIAKLESRLGVRLLDRSPHHVSLTPAGRVLLTRVAVMTGAWNGALADLAELHTAGLASARVSTEWIAGLPGLLAVLEQHWARPVVHSRGSVYQQIPRLLAEEVDLVQGFRIPTTHLDTGGAQVVTIAREPIWVYVAPHHRLASRARPGDHHGVHLAELAEQDWLATRLDQPLYEYLVQLCGRAGFTPRIAKITDSLAVFTDAFATGRYVTMGTPVAPRRFGPAVALPLTGPHDPDGALPGRDMLIAWNPTTLPQETTEHLRHAFHTWYTDLARTRQPTYFNLINPTASEPRT